MLYENGNLVVIGDVGIKIFDVPTKKEIKTIPNVGDYGFYPQILSNGILFYSDGIKIYSYEIATGKIKTFTMGNSTIVNSLTNSNGYLYVAHAHGFTCFDIQNQTIKWEYAAKSNVNAAGNPSVVNGILYIMNSENGSIVALNAVSGAVKWTYKFPHSNLSSYHNDITVSNGIVYAPVFKYIYALDAQTGTLKWEYISNDFINSISVGSDKLFFDTVHNLNAIDLVTANNKWTINISSGVSYKFIVYVDGMIYSNSNKINASNGQIVWSYPSVPIGSSPYFYYENPLIVINNKAYYPTSSGMTQ